MKFEAKIKWVLAILHGENSRIRIKNTLPNNLLSALFSLEFLAKIKLFSSILRAKIIE
jgi:hypothetical protein